MNRIARVIDGRWPGPAGVAPRWQRWQDLGVSDVATTGAYVGGYLLLRLLWRGSEAGREVALSLYYLPIYFVAAALSWRASRRPELDARTRRAWGILALAGLCTACGDVVWAYFELVRHTEDTPFWLDVVSLCGFPLWVAALLTFPTAPRAVTERAKFWLDIATVLVGGTMLSWFLVLRPTALGAHSSVLALIVSLAFPVSDLMVLVAVATVLARTPATTSRHPLRILVASALCGFVADLTYGHMRLLGTYHTGSAIDVLWLLDGALFALAARVQVVGAVRQHAQLAAVSDVLRPRMHLLAYVSVAAGFGLLLAIAHPRWDSEIGQALFGALALTALVVLRQVVAARDNLRLLAERAEREARFRHEALHDPLTGLANRALLRDRTDHALARARRQREGPLAMIFLDLDNFKTVNDSLGHAAGDTLLVEASRRLTACVRATDTAARLGGDEFAILLEDPTDEDGRTQIAERIIAALARPFAIEGRDVFVGASLGLATAHNGDGADDLLRNADVAMYMAKTRGKGRLERFAPEMHAVALERMELETDLRRAITGNEFVLHYQPIVILETGDITGVEALVRWQHPTRGLLAPGQFIRAAEETGLIVPLGAWVLREACHQAAAWHEREGRAIKTGGGPGDPAPSTLAIMVNISGRQLQGPQLVEDVRTALTASGIAPHTLVLELTESVLSEQTETVLSTLRALKALGVRLAIDDFGTGYSALSYLHRFPIDILKIAKPFIDEIGAETGTQALAQAIIALGSSLAVRTIAEGIERPYQSERLQALGCDLGQGYHFSRPITAAEMDTLLFGPGRRSAAVAAITSGARGAAPL